MDATVLASVPQVQLGDNLLDRPCHNVEVSLPAALNVVAAAKRDHIAIPIGAFCAGRRLCSPNGYHFVGLSYFWGFISHLPTIELVGLQCLKMSDSGYLWVRSRRSRDPKILLDDWFAGRLRLVLAPPEKRRAVPTHPLLQTLTIDWPGWFL